jgi:hypothetical protein
MRRLLAAAAVTVSAVAGAAAGASAAPVTQRPAYGTEYIQIMSASVTPAPASAIARGVFTAAGRADLGSGQNGTLVFPSGTITLSHQPSHGTSQIDPRASRRWRSRNCSACPARSGSELGKRGR